MHIRTIHDLKDKSRTSDLVRYFPTRLEDSRLAVDMQGTPLPTRQVEFLQCHESRILFLHASAS